MSTEANKTIVRRLWEEVWNQKKLAVADEIFDEVYAAHEKTFVPIFTAAFPDMHFTVEDMIAEGDKVVTRFTCTGTHKGEFRGIPSTGRRIIITGIWIHRLENGRIVEGREWGEADWLGLMRQIAEPKQSDSVIMEDQIMPELDRREHLLGAVRQLRDDLEQAIATAGPERMELPGSFGPWTFKDLIAHLTGWRVVTARRLEAGLTGSELTFPWPDHLDEGEDTDRINDWFYEQSREKPLDVVLAESRDTFEQVERALADLSEDDLFMTGRFAWLNWTDEGLGPAVIRGTWEHYYVEHEPDIRKWLANEDAE